MWEREAHASHLPHRLLQVGVQPSHAAGEEGVHHALREVATQVRLEEGDHLGLVGLPVKRQQGWLCLCRPGSRAKRPAARQWPGPSLQLGLPGPGVPSGPACSQDGGALCAGSVAVQAASRGQPVPTSSPAGPPVPCTPLPAACRGLTLLAGPWEDPSSGAPCSLGIPGVPTPLRGVYEVRAAATAALRCEAPSRSFPQQHARLRPRGARCDTPRAEAAVSCSHA